VQRQEGNAQYEQDNGGWLRRRHWKGSGTGEVQRDLLTLRSSQTKSSQRYVEHICIATEINDMKPRCIEACEVRCRIDVDSKVGDRTINVNETEDFREIRERRMRSVNQRNQDIRIGKIDVNDTCKIR